MKTRTFPRSHTTRPSPMPGLQGARAVWQGRWGVRMLTLLVLTLLIITPVSAHGFLVRAVPDDRAVLNRAPARVQYWFSEGLEPAFSKLTVRDANGTIVAEGGTPPDSPNLLSAQLPPSLPDGAYIADLRLAFASDGHVIAETRVFFIGEEVAGVSGSIEAQAEPVEILWRTVTLVGLMLSFGAAALYTRVLLPAWGSILHPAGGLPARVMSRLTLLMAVGLTLAFAAQILALLHQSVIFFGVGLDTVLSQSLWSVVRGSTRFGEVWNARMLIIIICGGMMAFGWFNRHGQPELTRPMWSASFWGLIVALGASSVISHAPGSRTAAWAALLLDWLHLIAVGLWVGGLSALVLVMPTALRGLDETSARKAFLAALRRFSPIAAACLAVVITSGIFSASLWLRPADVPSTSYGITLLVKLLMVAGLVGLGAVHFAALRDNTPGSQRVKSLLGTRLSRLATSLRLEVVFGLLTLIGAGWLTATPVPVPPDALTTVEPLAVVQQIGDYEVAATLSPGGPGANTLDLHVTRGGQPVEDAAAMMQDVLPSRDQRGQWNALEPLGGGVYSTVTADITVPGEWLSVIDLTLPDGEPLRAAFAWAITEEASIEPTIPMNIGQIAALGLALIGIGYAISPFARWVYRTLDWSPRALALAIIATVGSVAALIIGTVVLLQDSARYQAALNPPPAYVNTVLPDAASLARGEQLFAEACAWPPDATGWRDLASRLPRTRDEELFTFTRDGYRGLPACTDLTDTQRWDVVNAIRAMLQTERV